jgi:hypothetical protein
MPEPHGDVPPAIRKEWYQGTMLAVAVIGALLLIILFIALSDDLFSRAEPEETNRPVETGAATTGS